MRGQGLPAMTAATGLQRAGRESQWPGTIRPRTEGRSHMALDETKLNEFIGKFVGDLGATVAAGGVVLGHKLGLYKALAGGLATAEQLSAWTETNPRYIAEWLRGQAAGGYVEYDPAS